MKSTLLTLVTMAGLGYAGFAAAYSFVPTPSKIVVDGRISVATSGGTAGHHRSVRGAVAVIPIPVGLTIAAQATLVCANDYNHFTATAFNCVVTVWGK